MTLEKRDLQPGSKEPPKALHCHIEVRPGFDLDRIAQIVAALAKVEGHMRTVLCSADRDISAFWRASIGLAFRITIHVETLPPP